MKINPIVTICAIIYCILINVIKAPNITRLNVCIKIVIIKYLLKNKEWLPSF